MLKGVLNQHVQDSIIKLQMWDDVFLKQTRSVVKPEHFTAPETVDIVRVIYTYYDTYKVSPKDHFRNLMQDKLEKRNASDAEIEIYRFYLDRLDYEITANRDYILNLISDFVRRVTLRAAAIEFAHLLGEDKFKDAELLMYKALKSGIVSVDSGTDLINDIASRLYRHEPKEYLLHFGIPKLDTAVGGMERKTLVLIVAPLKGLKSWFLVHIGAEAIKQGLRVVHLSHEMSEKKVVERYDQALFELAHDNGKPKIWSYVEDDMVLISYPTSYHTLNEVGYIAERYKAIRRFGGKLFVKEYPTGTCTVSEVERYLEYLSANNSFSPDVIITDYGDIMAAEGNHSDWRSKVNGIYTRLRGLAVERNVLVVTASQAIRAAVDAHYVGVQHTAEDIRKPALADTTITIARTPDQLARQQGTLRVAAARDGVPVQFDFGSNLDFGQFYAYDVPVIEDDEEDD